MRLKTFLSTYLLFLCILFAIIGTVSVYMTHSQMSMLREKSTREYQTISAGLTRDISILYGQHGGFSPRFSDALESFMRGYARYYSRHNIDISLTPLHEQPLTDTELSFIQREQEHLIHITGTIRISNQFYQLDYYLNITETVNDLRNIQHILLGLSIVFSAVTAVGLYIILSRIFLPISIVASASKKIAGGNYGERIHISGSNELADMAKSFNTMTAEVESQIVGKQQFIDNFSHEMRSPLTSIYGYAEYLQKTPYDETQTYEATQTIMDEASHLKTIAESLLKLATLRNYSPVKADISIPQLFGDICQTLGSQANFNCKINSDTLQGQEDLIRSLLMNLCTNSIKAGATDITLEAIAHNSNIVLSVADNGCGIPQEDLARITEPFYRVDKARSRAQNSVGLGLTLCKQIVEAHGGTMRIESRINEGTTVTITFTNP